MEIRRELLPNERSLHWDVMIAAGTVRGVERVDGNLYLVYEYSGCPEEVRELHRVPAGWSLTVPGAEFVGLIPGTTDAVYICPPAQPDHPPRKSPAEKKSASTHPSPKTFTCACDDDDSIFIERHPYDCGVWLTTSSETDDVLLSPQDAADAARLILAIAKEQGAE